jgi:hypothetical protein
LTHTLTGGRLPVGHEPSKEAAGSA